MKLQVPSIVLPTIWTLGTETETVADVATHTSIEFSVNSIQNKTVHVFAQEVVFAGVPGPLWAWIELSPYPTTVFGGYWAAIGGGGGMLPPTAPVIIAGVGVNLAIHGFFLPWAIHSEYARLVIQTPVTVATAVWLIQAQISGS